MNNESTRKCATVDDLLGPVEKTRSKNEAITFVPLSDLHSFPNHPYQVRQNETPTELADSIREFGVLVPALVRPTRRSEKHIEIVRSANRNKKLGIYVR